MEFNAVQERDTIVNWIRDWFAENGPGCRAVLGVSGGKDSSVVAALCARALGAERVVGVMMPNGVQADIDVARDLIAHLGIRGVEINISGAYSALMAQLEGALSEAPTPQSVQNLPPRLRMATVYAVSQSLNGRVANTCNLSEDYVGYSTRYGDSVGDFSPISHLTVQEVKAVGRALGLPERFVEKPPIDGLCGKTDEENLGFSYAVLDRYIRTGECDDPETRARIDRLHRVNRFKLEPMPTGRPGVE